MAHATKEYCNYKDQYVPAASVDEGCPRSDIIVEFSSDDSKDQNTKEAEEVEQPVHSSSDIFGQASQEQDFDADVFNHSKYDKE